MLQTGVTIDHGPCAWRIAQQDATGHADFELSGRWAPYPGDSPDPEAHRVEARLVYEGSGCPVSAGLDWAAARMGPGDAWTMTLRHVPAGGLYRVETRVSRRGRGDDRPLRGDYIHCLGVGDLWCIAGQSNASGTGAGIAEDEPELGVHLFGNDELWKLATHPLEDATATVHPVTMTGIYHGHSPWLAFAKALKRGLGHPIGLIPAALGGSPLQRWNSEEPGHADLYENMLDMIAKAGGRVRGVIWYQGESDCNPEGSASYGHRFRAFAERLRRDLREPGLPILTAQLNRFTTPDLSLSPVGKCGAEADRAWSVVREAQRRLALELPHVSVIPTLDLALSDNIHNAAAAQVTLGQRFARVALGKVYGKECLAEFAQIGRARLEGRDVVAEFQSVSGGWTTVAPVTDFSVEDERGWVPIESVALGDEGEVRLRLGRALEGRAVLHVAFGADPLLGLRDGNRQPIVAFSVALPYVAER
ncbi:MAG: sialate O-acetylesterase [Anaerolineae bacterium]